MYGKKLVTVALTTPEQYTLVAKNKWLIEFKWMQYDSKPTGNNSDWNPTSNENENWIT